MFKKSVDKLKENFKKEGNQKKKIENLVLFLVLLVVVVLAINFIWQPTEAEEMTNKQFVSSVTDTKNTIVDSTTSGADVVENEYSLADDLEKILSKINGAGTVDVLVTYTESSQVVPMYNENSQDSVTEETDSEGGVRTISQTDNNKEVVYVEENGTKVPVTEKIIKPNIEGAIVLAEGANNASVKNNIITAVEALTGLATHKIQVFELE